MAAIRAGDIDAFLDGQAAYHAACLAAIAHTGPLGHATLQELASLHQSLLAELQTSMDSVSRRMGELSRGKRMTGAYSAVPTAIAGLRGTG